MNGGCSSVTCAADTDFAALVNVIDFCTKLYNEASDGPAVWQPLGPKDEAKLVERVLLPAREARNKFAHNSALSFASEEVVSSCISALGHLLQLLPLPTSSSTASSDREAALKVLQRMSQLQTGDSLATIGDELEGLVTPVLAVMRRACEHDSEALRVVMDEKVFEEVCAPVPRQPAPALVEVDSMAATGGAGSGAGAGGDSGDKEHHQTAMAAEDAAEVTVDLSQFQLVNSTSGVLGYDLEALTQPTTTLATRRSLAVAQRKCLYVVRRALA